MAEDQIENSENPEGGQGTDLVPSKKSVLKKRILLAVVLGVLIGGGILGVKFFGVFKSKEKAEEAAAATDKTVYLDLEEFLVNLNNPGNQVSFLKTVITLEMPNQMSLNDVQNNMPRIRDTFQVYLRELRNSDLQGSAGLQRLRTELLLRINSILEKGKVTNILFKEIIVQ